ncbi:MAG: DUF2490 domain-containing protein [Candidatus Binatia bacterium]
MRFPTALAFLFLTAAATPVAASQEDFQLWLPMTLNANFNDSFRGYYEVQPRIGHDASEVTQLILRTALDWRFKPEWAASFGYAWTPTLAPAYTNENRVYEQLLYADDYAWGRLTSRTRFEQRWIEGVSGTALRFRTMLRGQIPFTEDRLWSVAVQEEIFFNLNSPSGGPVAGFDQNRFFLGVNRRLSDYVSMDAGYQIQFVDTAEPGFPDRVNHVLLIQLFLQI